MSDALFSTSWYRVAKLKPRLRGHTRIYRHEYRGELWYVLQDHAQGKYYRFSPVAYQVIGSMDGERTVQEVWDWATDRFGDDAPTQDDVIKLLGQLHAADVLLSDVPPDTEEILVRSQRIEKAKWKQNLRSPLALRFPMVDPETFLEKTASLARPLFSVWGALLWLAVVGTATVLGAQHWDELTGDVFDQVFSAQNLLVLWITYPLVKTVHELGHGYAVKVWGGEVHEMGIMLLVLMPVPYVDASASSEFRARYRRVVVGAAGILVELFLASIALFVWLSVEPGMLRSVAYNIVLIGSISTVLFNGNPLLRYDGYYILADLLEIPNLAQRGTQYTSHLVKRYVFGVKNDKPIYTGPGEKFWFVAYTVTSFVYRMFIYVAIVLFIAGKFFFIGIILAAWAVYGMLVAPLYKGLKFVVSSPVLQENRLRAVVFTAGALALVAALLFALPAPLRTRTEGVVWAPEEALVRARTEGFVRRLVAEPNSRVARGDLLIECYDPLLSARVGVARAKHAELRARYDAAMVTDRVQVQVLREELADVAAELAHFEEKLEGLEVRSETDGVFIVPRAQDLPDRFVRRGDLVAFVLDVDRPTIRVVVPQSDVGLVRRQTTKVEVRLAERIGEILQATIEREVPEAEDRLPTTSLGAAGGGAIAIDPRDSEGTTTFEKVFQFDLRLDESVDHVFVGGRTYVRFDHGTEPLALQWYRRVRQMLLRRFNV